MPRTPALRRWLTGAVLLVSLLGVGVLTAGAAGAATVWTPVSPTTAGDPAPTVPAPTAMVLASTGLDIVWPVVVGLALLLAGTVAVGWAFLATGRRGQHR